MAQLKLDSLPAVLEHLNGMWSYASTEWLTLRVPNEADRTRSRWLIHPLWAELASIDWETHGGPLSRTFTPTRAPARIWLGARALSLVASMGSVSGIKDFDAACEELMREVSNSLSNRHSLTGLSMESGFMELVEINNRKYNLRMNPQDEDEAEDEPRFSNPYYRGKQGL